MDFVAAGVYDLVVYLGYTVIFKTSRHVNYCFSWTSKGWESWQFTGRLVSKSYWSNFDASPLVVTMVYKYLQNNMILSVHLCSSCFGFSTMN